MKKDNVVIIVALIISGVISKLIYNSALPACGVDIENMHYILDMLLPLLFMIPFYLFAKLAIIKMFKLDM